MGIELWAGMFVIGMWTLIIIFVQQWNWYHYKSKRKRW